jgi:hypothetical protein
MKHYRVQFLVDKKPGQLERLLNDRADEGYKLHTLVQMLHQTSEEVWTTLVFELDRQPERQKLFSEEMALEWTTPPSDDILLQEMRAAAGREDAVPMGDPLLDGGLER